MPKRAAKVDRPPQSSSLDDLEGGSPVWAHTQRESDAAVAADAQRQRHKRGPRFRSFVLRLRDALWARQVARDFGKSYNALDKLLLGVRDGERVRAMDRIARHGDSPERLFVGSRSLFQRAASRKGGADAAWGHQHFIWELLSGTKMPAQEILNGQLQASAKRLGLLRLDWRTAGDLVMLCGPNCPAHPGKQEFIADGVQLVEERSAESGRHRLDALLLLACMTHSAVDATAFGAAQHYLDALARCCERHDQEIDAGPFTGMIYCLLHERVVRQLWYDIHPRHWPYQTILRKKARQEAMDAPERHHMLKWDAGPFQRLASEPRGPVPLVEMDERMRLALRIHSKALIELGALTLRNPNAPPTAQGVLTRRGLERGRSPYLEAAASLWPATSAWATCALPGGRVVCFLDENNPA